MDVYNFCILIDQCTLKLFVLKEIKKNMLFNDCFKNQLKIQFTIKQSRLDSV